MPTYSGPPYPPPPQPGSNQIGEFIIGVSPVGTISTFNVWATVIAQYANSSILTGIITAFNEAMDQTENLDNFFDLIWNVLTAEGYGLSVWGRIVGVSNSLPVSGGSTATFGFNESGSDWLGFGQAPFTSGVSPTSNVTLTDDQFRPLVLAKAATNIWDGSIPGLNSILLALYQGRGTPYVQDGNNMSLTYVFPFALTPLDLAVIEQSGCLPQPAGVVINTSYP
jgi:Protein of unknown function (DUF2612)